MRAFPEKGAERLQKKKGRKKNFQHERSRYTNEEPETPKRCWARQRQGGRYCTYVQESMYGPRMIVQIKGPPYGDAPPTCWHLADWGRMADVWWSGGKETLGNRMIVERWPVACPRSMKPRLYCT